MLVNQTLSLVNSIRCREQSSNEQSIYNLTCRKDVNVNVVMGDTFKLLSSSK